MTSVGSCQREASAMKQFPSRFHWAPSAICCLLAFSGLATDCHGKGPASIAVPSANPSIAGDSEKFTAAVRGTGATPTSSPVSARVAASVSTDLGINVASPPPGVPKISAPNETGPKYIVVWTAPPGAVDHYDFGESVNGGTTWSTTSVTATSQLFANKPYGTYAYQVRACNASGCSAYTAPATVNVITALSDFPDAPVVPPSVPIPNQGWVGTLLGTPSVEGGSATYRIPIEVPPGRVGMQPELSLTYNSRNGNGVAGVGWAVSGLSKFYRCPRTLAQDGGNRTVQHDANDCLCMDGQRLVTANGVSYGSDRSEYRTELDHFSRIILHGQTSAWTSYFEVEKKSGRIAQYEPGPASNRSLAPETWYLTREFDRQGNCIAYTYAAVAVRGVVQDVELTAITYTGT
jgi:Salmonella virulence plasmid 65kDa B protein